MHQNLLNAEFASVEYLNIENNNILVIRIMNALTKVLLKSFCCTYACRQLLFEGLCNIPMDNTQIDRMLLEISLQFFYYCR